MKNSLGIAIKKANNALARDSDHYAKQLGLTGVQISTINYIADHEATQTIFQRDLEHEFNIRKATASSLVSTMVRKQLLVRVPAPTDARYKQLLLTPQARQLATQIEAFFETSERRIQTLLTTNTSLTYDSLTQISTAFTAENTPEP
ncbi:MarR family winged helix-turn-helix transcriptional regulator [Lactiplantibacillus sp. WILCCON 0030]|uniref:MarR family winged helix-turn-helix transcriptional regulator n=1 Tax=Lactiplantibacillus brownii TaxID=3069269 RepID=A0ABU1AB18_9LACO|nr:MarR family winged helix-turn-helix transcriptional regulator [Lactiplantibacillus brownii]MDQ7938119.1 MarR family winged helix-turn-helix transcriptional regulator [Lactiplantibacillus brownii]